MHRLLIPAIAGALITLTFSCAKNDQTQAREQEACNRNPTVSVSEQHEAGARPKAKTPKRTNDSTTSRLFYR
jgi:hypothetical protein